MRYCFKHLNSFLIEAFLVLLELLVVYDLVLSKIDEFLIFLMSLPLVVHHLPDKAVLHKDFLGLEPGL